MTIKFIHTSDWQIGKVFRFVDKGTMGLLQEARLAAITRLGDLAVEHDVGHILVAGDVYDMEALSSRSLGQPLERMRSFKSVTWHLMPGNHDPNRPHGLWEQLVRRDVPENVMLHLSAGPRIFKDDGFAVLPAPLQHRRTLRDPTEYMDEAETPDGIIRIGLAHGTVKGFGSDDKDIPNYISPERPKAAGLAYLALGDWHGQKKINEKVWYSGTHETDGFEVAGGGQALLVEIQGADSAPVVTPIETGHYRWMTYCEQINSREDIDTLVKTLRGSEGDLNRILVRLVVEGAVSLQDRQYFEQQIVDQISAAFRYLRIDDTGLFPRPNDQDFEQINQGGFVRTAADVLRKKAEDTSDAEHEVAALALQRLFVEHLKLRQSNQ